MRRRLLAAQDGFSLVVVLGVLMICVALTAGTFSAVVGDLPLRKESRERKGAYAAAEAGLNFYMSRLNQDNDYWTLCDQGPKPNTTEDNPVNQPWSGSGADPRKWRVVPGDAVARYTVEMLPVAGSSTCQVGAAAATSMIDPATGTMKVRATGAVKTERRTILATLRRKTFLDYIYFTDFEVQDPVTLSSDPTYIANCTKYRASRPKSGSTCFDIQFASGDKVNGPFHTNDDILACPGSTFGRSAGDRLEASGSSPGWQNPPGGSCGTGSPTFKSTFQGGVPALAVPTSNAKVASKAVSPYVLTGTNTLVLNGSQMTVTPAGGSPTTLALPDNGVIYDRSGSGCGAGASPVVQDYNEAAGCANLYVHGSYSKSLTIVSDKDIVVDGNLTKSGDYLLGLIASNYVRIQHKVTARTTSAPYTCTNVTPMLASPLVIDAAILSLQHSFIVDNYYCGAPLGTLQVNGAIAQRFRGPVGATDSGGTHGYLKDYNYDDRLKFRNPPFFLEPEDAAWRILRRNEQVPGVGAVAGSGSTPTGKF